MCGEGGGIPCMIQPWMFLPVQPQIVGSWRTSSPARLNWAPSLAGEWDESSLAAPPSRSGVRQVAASNGAVPREGDPYFAEDMSLSDAYHYGTLPLFGTD